MRRYEIRSMSIRNFTSLSPITQLPLSLALLRDRADLVSPVPSPEEANIFNFWRCQKCLESTFYPELISDYKRCMHIILKISRSLNHFREIRKECRRLEKERRTKKKKDWVRYHICYDLGVFSSLPIYRMCGHSTFVFVTLNKTQIYSVIRYVLEKIKILFWGNWNIQIHCSPIYGG
jgi:hypothetical protein